MVDPPLATPLLAADSPLEASSRQLIKNLYEEEQAKAKTLPTDNPLDPKRRRRVELTHDEMWAQPEAIRTTLHQEQAIAQTAAFLAKQSFERVYMVGCGDSLTVMVAVRALFEQLLGIPCEPLQSLDAAYYYYRSIHSRTLVITLSSSGVTTRTVEAMLLSRALGAKTLALTNTPGSALMEESDQSLLVHAERKGWPTQASTAAIALLCQLVILWAQHQEGITSELNALEAALHRIPDQIANALQAHDAAIAALAEAEARRSIYLFAGGGPAYACALFGAAKVKECTPDHAIAIPLEEYHHYNSQKAGDPLFLIAPPGPSLSRAADTIEEGHRWGGQIYTVLAEAETRLAQMSDACFRLPALPEVFAPLLFTVPVQQFAYHLAMAKFRLAETTGT